MNNSKLEVLLDFYIKMNIEYQQEGLCLTEEEVNNQLSSIEMIKKQTLTEEQKNKIQTLEKQIQKHIKQNELNENQIKHLKK